MKGPIQGPWGRPSDSKIAPILYRSIPCRFCGFTSHTFVDMSGISIGIESRGLRLDLSVLVSWACSSKHGSLLISHQPALIYSPRHPSTLHHTLSHSPTRRLLPAHPLPTLQQNWQGRIPGVLLALKDSSQQPVRFAAVGHGAQIALPCWLESRQFAQPIINMFWR